MTAAELLETLNLLDEHERIEAKRATEAGRSVMETICAYANEPDLGGGWLLLGVVKKEAAMSPQYEVEGIANPDKISNDIASQCRTMFNRPLQVSVTTEKLNDKAVIVVHVPEVSPQEKPVYFKNTGLPRGAFRRISSTDQRCTEDDLAVFYQSHQSESFDAGVVSDASLEDIDEDAVNEYRNARAEVNPDAEELGWTDDELLQALKAVRRNRNGQWQPTVAGLLLFGKSAALRRCFPMTRVDYIRVPGREWVPNPDRRFDTVELRGPMFSLLRRAQAAVLDDLPTAFGLEEGQLQRSGRPAVPQRALREALVNALMHRSYRTQAPVQIIRYANRLEIRNPGFSLKSPEHLGEPGSIPRNPVIAAVLHETRYAETKGSGIRAIREVMDEAGLAPPLFESDRSRDQFVTQFLFHHFLGEDDIQWLAQFRDLHLTDEEARALIVAREAGEIDNPTYRTLNKVDPLTASASLRRLRDAGLLTQHGRGPATRYKPTSALVGGPDHLSGGQQLLPLGMQDSLSDNPVPLSSKSGALSSKSDALSSKSDALSSKLEEQQPDSTGQGARETLLSQLPDEMVARIKALGQRHPPEQVRDLVVDLCRQRDWHVRELALLLSRTEETVRQSYLRPLLAQKRLVMTRPDTPNSPQQAYRAAERTDR